MQDLRILRDALPHNYGKLISETLPTVTPQQAVRVMNGEITDIKIVLPVLEAAAKIYEDEKKKSSTLKSVLEKISE